MGGAHVLKGYRVLPEPDGGLEIRFTQPQFYSSIFRDVLDGLDCEYDECGADCFLVHEPQLESEIRSLFMLWERHPLIDDDLDASFCLSTSSVDTLTAANAAHLAIGAEIRNLLSQIILFQRDPSPDSIQQENGLAERLAGMVCKFVNMHPVYRKADVVVAVPNYLTKHLNIASLFAARIVEQTDMLDGSQAVRFKGAPRPDGSDDYRVHGDATGSTVLLVDFFYRFDSQARLLAERFREAGVAAVLGLAVFRE